MPTTPPDTITHSLHQQMIFNEIEYQAALKKDEPFSVLKKFKNKLKKLKSELERPLPKRG